MDAPERLSDAELEALRGARGHDVAIGLGCALAALASIALARGLAAALLGTTLGAAAGLFLLRGGYLRLRRGTLVEGWVERRELSPVARPGGEPMPQLVIRVRRRLGVAPDGACRTLPCEGERRLVDVERSAWERAARWQVVRLLYAPDGTLVSVAVDAGGASAAPQLRA